VTWRALEAEAPELARLGRARLEAVGMALLGTIRADGSPRISPIGTVFAAGELLVGVMPRSAKATDIRRDPRCALQSVITDPEAGAPELKLYGRLGPSDVEAGWWEGRPGAADVYALDVEEAVYIEWDTKHSRMTVRRWLPGGSPQVVERAYP
jgi:pyridoxamine 5'-phosphate oxidase-like protein